MHRKLTRNFHLTLVTLDGSERVSGEKKKIRINDPGKGVLNFLHPGLRRKKNESGKSSEWSNSVSILHVEVHYIMDKFSMVALDHYPLFGGDRSRM